MDNIYRNDARIAYLTGHNIISEYSVQDGPTILKFCANTYISTHRRLFRYKWQFLTVKYF